jgi:VWFA-related protein
MNRAVTVLLVAFLSSVGLSHAAQPTEAVDPAIQEHVRVRLLTVDALVIDAEGRTVPGLTQQDFQLDLGGKMRPIETFDVACPIGAAEDPKNVDSTAQLPPPIGPGLERRVILAFDYYFLPITDRAPVLAAAAEMLRASKTPEEEVMIAALAYGVRIEQRFTSDLRQLVATLDRMEHDVTLWAKEFAVGASGREYLTDLATLMDVASSYGDAKAVVLFSEVRGFSQTNDLWFNDVTMRAASARAAIYPSYAGGLDVNWGSDTLVRLANQSGGRMPMQPTDITLAYRWAQRDLSCRYTLGVYLGEDEGRERQSVRVLLDEQKGKLRFPEMVKYFTDEEKLESRARAAFLDPGPYENPLVRSFAFPMRPASGSTWDTLLALTLPLPVGPTGRDFTLAAKVQRGATRAGKYESTFHVDSPAGGGDTRHVTVFGDAELKAGQHRLTVVLSEPGGTQVVSAETQFTVPDMVEGLLMLRGPAFARVVPGAKMFHAGGKAKEGPTKVEQMLGAEAGFEPLLVNEIESRETLLAYWSGCVLGKSQIAPGAVVRRRFVGETGETAHELAETSLQLESRGQRVQCQEMLEELEPNTLPAGDYRYEVTVTSADGQVISRGEAPLSVR